MLALDGERQSGSNVRNANCQAALAVANVVRSSLGPVGLDKMLVDDIGDMVVTNDGATILKLLEVDHPAGRVLVELSRLQDEEVGDGTTSVVIIAAELLKRANELVKANVHPTSVIAGFQHARKEAVKFIANSMTILTKDLGRDSLINCAKTSMSSKIVGLHADHFSEIVVSAMERVKVAGPDGKKDRYPLSAIKILKVKGKSSKDSTLVDGVALFNTRASEGMPKRVTDAKIALVDFDLRQFKLAFGVQVLVETPEDLERIRERERDVTKERIDKLMAAGAKVILTSRGIDDMALKYFVEAGAIAVRRVDRADMRRIAKATGATVMMSLADEEGAEVVDPSLLGYAAEVGEEHISDDRALFFRGCQTKAAQTIVIRGANDYMLDEVERSLHDALCIVKRTLESGRVVPGGGVVEAALSVYLEHVAETMSSREQLAVAEFAEAMLVIPKTLALNGAHDSAALVAKLRSYHAAAQRNADKQKWKNTGLDLKRGKVRDSLKAGVLEPAMSKVRQIKSATEAAIAILRIDDAITIAPKADPKNPVSGHEQY